MHWGKPRGIREKTFLQNIDSMQLKGGFGGLELSSIMVGSVFLRFVIYASLINRYQAVTIPSLSDEDPLGDTKRLRHM